MKRYIQGSDRIDFLSMDEKIDTVVEKFMRSHGFPEFEDGDINDYYVTEYYRDPETDTMVEEVRCELKYADLDKLATRLNKIIQKYDPDAFFEHIDFGIIRAYFEGE